MTPRSAGLAFLPYLILGVIHLTAKIADVVAVDQATKPLLMPALLVGVAIVLLRAAPSRRNVPAVALLAVALILSWLGDVFIADADITLGLAAFLGAHLAYLAVFASSFRGRISWWGLIALPWFAGLVVLLAPHVGGMLPLLVVYGAVLGAMAVTATRGGPLTSLGAVLFVVSDSMLAFRIFTPLFASPLEDALIMAAYLAAQLLLVLGVLRLGYPVAGPPAPARPRSGTAL